MGAWGDGPFDNDAALDWLPLVVDRPEALETAFDAACSADRNPSTSVITAVGLTCTAARSAMMTVPSGSSGDSNCCRREESAVRRLCRPSSGSCSGQSSSISSSRGCSRWRK